MSSRNRDRPRLVLRDPEVFIYELLPGFEAEYDRRHATVWPEVIADLRGSGITEYTIHRHGTLVISIVRRNGSGGAPELCPQTRRRVKDWHELMAPLFAAVQDEDGEPLYAAKIFDISTYPATA